MDRLRKSREKPITVVVSGIIGAGKSTIISLLGAKLAQKGIKVVIIYEPVEYWKEIDLLQTFYGNIPRWAYTFQGEAFRSRIMAIRKAYQENPDAKVFLMERSPWDDRIFMEMLHDQGKVNKLEWSLYQGWCEMWELLLPLTPDAFVLLDPSVQVCQERVKKRSRPGEENVSDEYQTSLKEYHDRFFYSGNLSSSGTEIPQLKPSIEGDDIEESTALVGSLLVPCYHLKTEENFRDHPESQEKMVAIFERILKAHS